MAVCGKCDKVIENQQEQAVCVECKKCFHPICTRIKTLESFKKSSANRKASWKCDECHTETSSTASRSSDKDLVDRQTAVILESMEKMRADMNTQFNTVNENVSGVRSELATVKSTVETLQATLSNLTIENEERKSENATLKQENIVLKEQVSGLKIQVEDIQQYMRRDNIEIRCVPYTKQEDIYYLLEELAKLIRVHYLRSEISVAHRLPTSDRNAHPPILVKFVSRSIKMAWMAAARRCEHLTAAELHDSWESTRIFFNDHLTGLNKMLLGRSRGLVKDKKLEYAWCKDSRVFVRKTAEGPAIYIRTEEDLEKALQGSKK